MSWFLFWRFLSVASYSSFILLSLSFIFFCHWKKECISGWKWSSYAFALAFHHQIILWDESRNESRHESRGGVSIFRVLSCIHSFCRKLLGFTFHYKKRRMKRTAAASFCSSSLSSWFSIAWLLYFPWQRSQQMPKINTTTETTATFTHIHSIVLRSWDSLTSALFACEMNILHRVSVSGLLIQSLN